MVGSLDGAWTTMTFDIAPATAGGLMKALNKAAKFHVAMQTDGKKNPQIQDKPHATRVIIVQEVNGKIASVREYMRR
jgi:hypothetical protein